ncbi:hypothetical protein ACS0TY_025480 [Phlomoides rotata]
MQSGETRFEFDRCHVKGLLLDLLVAESDTSVASTEWTLSKLIRHPKIMNKLQKELESVVGMDCIVEESHLDKLQYLNCVVKESFCLHTIVPLLLPHKSIEDCIIYGFRISKKSRVMVNVWAIGRHPNFGQKGLPRNVTRTHCGQTRGRTIGASFSMGPSPEYATN